MIVEVGIIVDTNECIEWDGTIGSHGYGLIRGGQLAHRAVWEENYGRILPGHGVYHRCDNRPCINPDHLFSGPRTLNELDKVAKGGHHNQKKTHCPHGHLLSGDNLSVYMLRRGVRHCKACDKAKYQRRKSVQLARRKERYKQNREEFLAKQKEYRRNNPERVLELRELNKEKVKLRRKAYMEKNGDVVNARRRELRRMKKEAR